jgi:hypothetical protein
MTDQQTNREEQIKRMSLENDVDTGAMTAVSIYVVIFLYALGSAWDLTLKVFVSLISMVAVIAIYYEYHKKREKIDNLFRS